MSECCQGCDQIADAATIGIVVHGHEDAGCYLSATQQKMLAARIEDHKNLLAEQARNR
jgi:hypothetical protein